MIDLPTDFSYLSEPPLCSAKIRCFAEDFQVVEELGFTPEGAGEHVFLYIRKTGENTDWVARQLANFAQISPRDVSYAGKKDRHAVTEQWFCVKFPIKRNLNWALFGGDSIQVLQSVRHPRKLRLGTLQGNRFRLCLREVSDMQELQRRVEHVAETGVPNYFGEQRFGRGFGNLTKGIALLKGEYQERQRNKKGMYISAVRSWLFNQFVSQRIEQGLWSRLLLGDAMMIEGSHSCFVIDEIDESIQERFVAQAVHVTAPMWGHGDLLTQVEAREWENAQAQCRDEICQLLCNVSLKQERRAIRLLPKGLHLDVESDNVAWLEFSLPAGAFATSVLRELCNVSVSEQTG